MIFATRAEAETSVSSSLDYLFHTTTHHGIKGFTYMNPFHVDALVNRLYETTVLTQAVCGNHPARLFIRLNMEKSTAFPARQQVQSLRFVLKYVHTPIALSKLTYC